MPQKRYIVRLTAQEREICQQTVRKLNGSSEKVRRAQILLKADADGPAWTDQRVAEAFSCRTKTVENIRQRCVQEGLRMRSRLSGGGFQRLNPVLSTQATYSDRFHKHSQISVTHSVSNSHLDSMTLRKTP